MKMLPIDVCNMYQFILPYQFMWKNTGISCRLHAHMPRHENMSTQLLASRADANAHTYVFVCLKVYVQSNGAVSLPTRFILNGY